jgi:hypothetical protein
MSNPEIQIWVYSEPNAGDQCTEGMRAGEGPFVSDGICQKIICLEKYVSGFIEVLGRAKFTLAVR